MKAGGRGRQLALIILCGFVTACSGHQHPPSTMSDACRMQSERPQWFQAMRKTEDKWGVPVSVQLATIARESSFRHDARPVKRIGSGWFSREVPRSSAYGYAQALDGTPGTTIAGRPGGGAPTATTSPIPPTSSAGTCTAPIG